MSSSEEVPRGQQPPPGFWARWDMYTGILGPFQLAAWYYLGDVWAHLRRADFTSVLFRNHDIREHAFAEFYQAVSHHFVAYESTTPVPTLVSSAHGIILELGPGPGAQLHRFTPSLVHHIYGVEPNAANFAPALADRLRDTALGADGKYTLVPCGVGDGDALARFGIVEGSVDCVVSMQVLCSIPDLEAQVRHIYKLLKPGGELIFWEHCRSPDPVTRAVQWLWCLLWPTVIGGCRLDRVTKEVLVKAADWERVEVDTNMFELPHDPMPRLWGRMFKPGTAYEN